MKQLKNNWYVNKKGILFRKKKEKEKEKMIKFSSVSKMDVHRFCTQTHFLNARDTTITKNGGSILVCNKCANNFRIGNFKKWFELEDQNENVRSFGKLKDATFNKEG